MVNAPWQKSKEYLAYQIYNALAGPIASTPGESPWQKSFDYWLMLIYNHYGGAATNHHKSTEYWLSLIANQQGASTTTHQADVYLAYSWYNAIAAVPIVVTDSSAPWQKSLEYWLYLIWQESLTPPVTPWYEVAGYTPIAAYQPKGAASQAASYINLANPGTLNANPIVAPTWNAVTGWTLNGLTQWLDSGVVPASDQSYSLFVRYANATGANGCVTGMYTVNPGNRAMQLWHDAGGGVVYANGQFLIVGASLATGILAVAGDQGYRNGVADGGLLGPWGGTATHSLAIGARNSNGVADTFAACDVLAWAVYANPFSAAEVLATTTAMGLI